MNVPGIVRYLRACYRSDSRHGAVANLHARSVEHLRWLPDDSLLSGSLDWLPLPSADVTELAQAAALYRREKTLVYHAFPLIGRGAGGPWAGQRLFAPLLVFPAELSDPPAGPSGVHALRVDLQEPRLNAPALEALLGDIEGGVAATAALWEECPQAPFQMEQIQTLIAALGRCLPELETLELLRFPELLDEPELRAALETAADGPARCLPAAGLALLPNSPETRGLLFELGELAAATRHSVPLERLLGSPPRAERAADPRVGRYVPAVLSRAQARAADAASRFPLSLVVGPPGTGKSYTAAAIAVDHVARGESVLIASRSEQALDVIEDKLTLLLGQRPPLLRAGRRDYLRELKGFLDDLLHGRLPGDETSVPSRRLEKRLRSLARACRRRERSLALSGRLEQRWGELSRPEGGFVSRLWRVAARRAIRLRLSPLEERWAQLASYEQSLAEHTQLASELVRTSIRERLEWVLAEHRDQLSRFRDALRARHSSRQERLFSTLDLDVLLRTFPLWMTSFQDAARAVPFEPELFDLAIVDEATHSDMASCLPVIQRAKRVAVIGDFRQLRHVSFLARRRQQAHAERHELTVEEREILDYRSRSLLDLVSDRTWSAAQVVSLDEHFRSAPPIIAFSNREFYGGSLKVMTSRPAALRQRAVELRTVPGKRAASGVNRREADVLVDELVTWTEREASWGSDVCHSLGVLSPYRDQVEYLRKAIGRRLSLAAVRKHDLLIGTPYAFQGEERDVMLLSLAVDDASPTGSFVYLERSDVFNVSITRARTHQIVFSSLSPERRDPDSLVRRYLEEIARPVELLEVSAAQNAFARELTSKLEQRGYRTWPDYLVAGMEVDLLVEKDRRSLGIDLIGQAGASGAAFDLERCRMLRRAGLPVFPLPLAAWQDNPTRCLDALEAACEES